MAAEAEAGAHDAEPDRLAHQELLRALAGLVIVVDDAVVGRQIAVELLGLAADGQRREQHVVGGALFFFTREQHFERVARLRLALEVDVVRIDAHQIVDHRARDLIAQRGFVDALIEPHCGRIVLVVLVRLRDLGRGRHALHVDRDVLAGVGERDHRLDGIAGHDHAHDAQASGIGREQDAQLLPFAQATVAAARAQHGGEVSDVLGRGALIAQDRGSRFIPSSPRPAARSRRSGCRSASGSSAAS